MEKTEIIEGNLKAVKDIGGFEPNMWFLYIRSTEGRWESIQWMGVQRIQELFETKLPVYERDHVR
jgi:hypothetical protein